MLGGNQPKEVKVQVDGDDISVYQPANQPLDAQNSIFFVHGNSSSGATFLSQVNISVDNSETTCKHGW